MRQTTPSFPAVDSACQQKSQTFAWLLCLLVLAASIGLFYPQVASLQGCFLTGDHREQHYPWASFLDASLSRGELPWWTWKIHCGFPLLAEGQIAAFYPPNLALHFLFSTDTAYGLSFLLHLFLSGWFFALYCRGMGWGWPGVALGALAYLYGNAYGGAYYNFTSLKTLCWFPLALVLADRIFQRGKLRDGFWLGAVFAMQLLAGYLQMAVYSIAMTGLYCALRFGVKGTWYRMTNGGWHELSGSVIRYQVPFTKRLAAFFLAFVVMAMLFLPQFLATYPLSQMSGRVGLQESFAYIGSFPPWGLGTLLFPKMEGLLRTLGLYVGIWPLFLAVLSLGNWREPSVRRWAIFLGISLLLAMGGYSPLYVALVKATGFYGFRVPSKLLFFSNMALAVLAGWGLEALLRKGITPKAWRIAKALFLCVGGGAIALLLLGGVALDALRQNILECGYAWVKTHVFGQPYHTQSLEYYRSNVDCYYEMAVELFRVTNPKTGMALLTLFIALTALSIVKLSWRRSALAACCLGLSFADLYAYHFINKVVGDFSTFQQVKGSSPAAVFLAKDKSLHRIFSYRGRFQDLSLVPSYNMLFGVEDIGAYSPFVMKRYRDLLEGLGAVDDSTGRVVGEPARVLATLPLLSALNVKYILTTKANVLPGLPEVFATATEHVYLNAHAQERFFFAQGLQIQKDPKLLLQKVRWMDLDSMRTVWMEEDPPQRLDLGIGGDVRVLVYGDRQIVLDVDTPKDNLLFGSLLRYPGIVATLDGAPARVYTADYCFCAVLVPKGRHRIVFAFDWKRSLGFPGLRRGDRF